MMPGESLNMMKKLSEIKKVAAFLAFIFSSAPSVTGQDLSLIETETEVSKIKINSFEKNFVDAGFNRYVLAAIRRMPIAGGYATSVAANNGLRKSIKLQNGAIRVSPTLAVPSYCSGATYLVFLMAFEEVCSNERVSFTDILRKKLIFEAQPDGVGIWGRWNSNGPGTARLFFETGLGVNFLDPKLAKAGDFLKVFWNEYIGAREKGHSVIFLGWAKNENGDDCVRYWSSNMPEGYGESTVPLKKIKLMLFSRFNSLGSAEKILRLEKDTYLSEMLQRDSDINEVKFKIGIIK